MENLSGFVPIILMFGIAYFLILRPQAKERESHDKLIAGLSKGDRVVTSSGIHGKVTAVKEETVTLEISKGTQITLDKPSIARREGEGKPADAAASAKN